MPPVLAGENVNVQAGSQSEGDDPAPLGIATKFTSTPVYSQVSKFQLLSAAQELLPGERVSICHKHLKAGQDRVEVIHNPIENTARYGGLMKCKSIWSCPCCAARITEERRQELRDGLANCTDKLILITYTLRHAICDPLKDMLSALKASFSHMRSGRRWQDVKNAYGVKGGILSTEVTWGENGWHVHRHELLFLPADIETWQISLLERKLKTMWLESLRANGRDGTWEYALNVNASPNIDREYIAKHGYDPKDSGWTVTHEMTKSPAKRAGMDGMTPFQLLEDYHLGNKLSGAKFREYALTFKGSKQLHWSSGLREYLGMMPEIPDEELEYDQTEIDDVVIYEICYQVWRELCKLKIRGELLDVARLGDQKHLERWIEKKTGLRQEIIDLQKY